MYFDDKYKLIVVIYRNQKTFYMFVMNCKNNSIYVQRQIDRIFRSFRHYARIYVDDVIIFSKTLINYVLHFRVIFDFFVKLNIVINFSKTYFDYFDVQLFD